MALVIPNTNPHLTHLPSSVNNQTDEDNIETHIIHGYIQWFDLKLFIINIYAPSGNEAKRRICFEKLNLLLTQHHNDNIILGGDFNCILNPTQDKLTKPRQRNKAQDVIILERLIFNNNLIDTWCHFNHTTTEATYGRGGNKISRLDRIYISENLTRLLDSAEIIRHTASDHNPFRIKLRSPNNTLIAKSIWRLNSKLLLHEKYKKIISDIINNYLLQINPQIDIVSWYKKLKICLIRNSKRYGIGHKYNISAAIESKRTQIKELELSIPESDSITTINTRLTKLYWELDQLLVENQSKSSLRCKTTISDTTDAMTKSFFKSIKTKNSKEFITTINSTNGTVRTQQEISEAICSYYENLYSDRQISQEKTLILLDTIKNLVPTSDFMSMNKPITSQEVTKAIQNIATEKAPGPDGLNSEFYKQFASLLSTPLSKLYQECINTGQIPEFISLSKVQLLFKKGDRQEIGNWRPISLLNVDYKIFAKIITERMKSCLPKILHPDQKGFVPTRRLEDAVMKATSLIEYCNSQNLPKYMMLLDQEKAFDRVSRQYMHQVLTKFHFPPQIIKAVEAMYANTYANISVNGFPSRTLDLRSGVRQGCPLSPTLFALCIEPLGNLIRQNTEFTGIKIPGIGQYKLSKFADDTVLFLNNQTDHDIARICITTYEEGSSAKANVSKTEILPIGPNVHNITNPLTTDIKILNHNAEVRFLGVTIGNKVNTNAIWDTQLNKLSKSLLLWDSKNLSYEGKVMALRNQALCTIWFHAKFHHLPISRKKQIESLVKTFICKGKRRAPIQYSIMKYPRNLGGINIPDIDLQYTVLRMSWIKAFYDKHNHADWKPLVAMSIEQLSNTPGIGYHLISYPKKFPKLHGTTTSSDPPNPEDAPTPPHHWIINYNAFKKLKGTILDDRQDLLYTPQGLSGERIAAYCDMNYFTSRNVTEMSQIIKPIHEDGSVELKTPKTIKSDNRLDRLMQKRSWDSLNTKILKETRPPEFVLTSDDKSDKVIHIFQEEDKLMGKTFRPIKIPELQETDLYEQSDSPVKQYKRNKTLELGEIVANFISTIRIVTNNSQNTTGPIQNPLASIGFKLGELPIKLMDCTQADIYKNALRAKAKKEHQHYQMYDSLLEPIPEWPKLPNRRAHKSAPNIHKDYRYLTMHNAIMLGRKLTHIPDIEPEKIHCHNCSDKENSIIHLLIYCPATSKAWKYIRDKWSIIISTYEHFVDDNIEIKQYQLLLGITTPNPPKGNNIKEYNTYILIQTLDIMLANMQTTIIKQLKQYLYDLKRPPENELIHTFDQHMSESINKTYTRMKNPNYKQQWLYTRPSGKLSNTDKASWFDALSSLLRHTLINPEMEYNHLGNHDGIEHTPTTNTPIPDPIDLSSDLEYDDLIENMF